MTLGFADLSAGEAGVFGPPLALQDAPPAPGGGQTQALTEAPAAHGPLISGPASLLWTGVGAVLAVFFLVFFVLVRTRLTRAAPARARGAHAEHWPASRIRKAPQTDFFEPAGEDAEITFDDEPAKPAQAQRPSPPAAHPKAHQGDLTAARAEEAEIVIERPAHEEPAAKSGAFAGLFARKEPSQSTPYSEPGAASLVKMKSHPLASERRRGGEDPQNDNDAETRREQEEERQRAFAEIEERRLAQRRHAEEESRRLEEEETARREQAFAAAEQRRLAAEQETARETEARARDEARRRQADEAAAAEQARLAAERAAEFESRKKAAALEQRERELAQWAEELAGDNDAFKRQVGEEFDRRFAALSSSLEERAAAPSSDQGVAAALTALSRDLDQRLGEINERLETRLVGLAQTLDEGGAPGEPWENVSAMAEMVSRRISDHRESINATIAALSNRIDTFAGAAEEVTALRKDISSLKRAMGERAYGPGAATVQLADLVKNSLPPDAFELRASLANNRKADCLIRLPYPPGPIAIDARFPIEAFQALYAGDGPDKTRAENEFRRAALRHIVDIAERLIVPEETAESALMFLPSESMYATLHERFPDIVQDSYRARVWIVSPTTLMATLHTVRAVMRDAQARESAELIHTEAQHVFAEVDALRRRVIKLEEDFGRAHHDVRDVLSSTDQVFRRAESISKTHRTLADDILGRGSRRILSAAPEESEQQGDRLDEEGDPAADDLGGDPPPADRQPFPLR